MKRLNYFFAAAISVIMLTACDDGTTCGDPVENKPIDSTVYHPLMSLKVGNAWNYQVTEYNPDGSLHIPVYTYQDSIVKDTLIEGVKTFLIAYDGGAIHVGYANKADGLYEWYPEEEHNLLNRMVKYPVSKGESYDITLNPSRPDDFICRISVEATNLDVTVPAGTFKCVKLKRTGTHPDKLDYFYYSEEIGLIKWENMMNGYSGGQFYLFAKYELINKNF